MVRGPGTALYGSDAIGGPVNVLTKAVAAERRRAVTAGIACSRRGRTPFVLSLWSLDCVHHRDDLALLSKLTAKYPSFLVVLVATDTPKRQDNLQAVLGSLPSPRRPWVCADSFVGRLRYRGRSAVLGELPRIYF